MYFIIILYTYILGQLSLPSPEVGKSSTGLTGWGYGVVCSAHVSGGRKNCDHMASDTPYLWDGFFKRAISFNL